MARPTKFNQTIQEKAEEYLNGGWSDNGDVVPSIVGLAHYLGVSKQSILNWGEADSRFFDTLSDIKGEQERITMNGALTNTYNATISKLILANHGYSEKQEQVISGGDKPVKVDSTFNILPVKPKDA